MVSWLFWCVDFWLSVLLVRVVFVVMMFNLLWLVIFCLNVRLFVLNRVVLDDWNSVMVLMVRMIMVISVISRIMLD